MKINELTNGVDRLRRFIYVEQLLAIFIICLLITLPAAFVDAIGITEYTIKPDKTSATFTVTTDSASKIELRYGDTGALGLTKLSDTPNTRHTLDLTGLNQDTKYGYRLLAKNPASDNIEDDIKGKEFKTLDNELPKKVIELKNLSQTTNSIKIAWKSSLHNARTNPFGDSDLDKYIIYRSFGDSDETEIARIDKTVTEYLDINLAHSTRYIYRVQEIDTTGMNKGEKSDPLTAYTLEPDLSSPVLSEPKILALADNSASIEIAANEEISIALDYGESPQQLTKREEVSIFKQTHQVNLINLKKDQAYFYKIRACDTAGNCVDSDQFNFVAGSDITPPAINAVIPRYVNDYDFQITGTTDAYTIVEVYVNDQLTSRRSGTHANPVFSLLAKNLREGRINKVKLVAQDLAGNKAQLEGEVDVDRFVPEINITTRISPQLRAGHASQNTAPDAVISGLPAKLARDELEIDGFVNEQVTITYSTTDINDKPAQIKNLNATNIDSDSVTLTWEKIINIEKYIVYRASSPNIPIAIVTTQTFRDDRVRSGTTYKYQIVALRNDGIVGEPSRQINVKTLLADGKAGEGNDAVTEVNISDSVTSKAAETLEANGPFKLLLQLKEGRNSVLITIADKANNKVEFKKDVFVDTIAPAILDPTDLSFFSPSYLPAVEIKGKVDTPGATVMILVNGKCSGSAMPSSLSGIFFKATTDYKCKVTADDQGNFKMNIELDKTGFSPDTIQGTKQLNLSRQGFGHGQFGGKAEAGSGTQFKDYQFDPKALTRNEIRIIAIDENGLQSQEIKDFIEYRACGEGGAWQIDIPATEFTPTVVYSEHLIRGFAQFGFNMYFKYQGSGDPKDARILGEPRITELELSEADQKKFGHSQLLTSPQTTWSEDYKTGHALYTLAKWTKDEKELKKVKKLKLPLMVEFDYSQNIFGEQRRATQKTCVDITSLGVEHRLDVEGKIPEAFLNDAIGAINQTLEVINQILEPLQKLQAILMFSCLGSWVVLWVWNTIYVRWSCIGVWDNARGSLAVEENWPGKDAKFPTCEKGEDKKALSEEDKSTCQSCVKKFQSFRKWDMRMHLLCDRVFCPSVPDLNVHKRVTRDVYLAGIGNKQNACEDRTEDYYFRGGEKVLQAGATKLGGVGRLFNYDDKLKDPCKAEYQRNWENACLLMDEWKEATTDPDKKDAFGKVFSAVADMCKPKPANKDKLVRQPIRDGKGEQQYQDFISKDGKFYESQGSIEELPTTDEGKKGVVTVGEGKTTKRYRIDENKPFVLGYTREGKSSGKLFTDKNNDGEISELEMYNDKNRNGRIDNDEALDNNYAQGKGNTIDISNNKALQDEFEPPGDYIVDPTSGIIRAAQCVCIPALVGYLTLWKGILDAVKKCFQSVLITKKAQSGLCKSVLTVYICDIIYDVISCITKKYSGGAGTKVKADGIGGFFAAMSGASNDVQNSVVNRYGESAIYKNLFSERKLIHTLCIGAFTGDWDVDVQQFLQGQVKIPITSQGWVPTATRRFITADPNNDGLATYIYHVGAGLIAGSDVDWSLELLCSNNNDCNQADNDAETNACDCAQGSRPGEQAIRIDGGRLRAGESIGGTDEQGDRYIPLTHRIRYDKVRLRWSYQDNNGKTQTDEVINPISFTGGSPPVHCKFDVAEASFNCGAALGDLGTLKFVEKPKPKKQIYTIGDQIKLDAQIIKKSPNYQIGKEDARIAGVVGIQSSTKTDPKKQLPKWVVFTLYNQHNSPVVIDSGTSTDQSYRILERDGAYSTEVATNAAEGEGLKIDWLLPNSYQIKRGDFRRILGKGEITPQFVKEGQKTLPSLSASYDIQRGSTAILQFAVIAQKESDGKIKCYVKGISSQPSQANSGQAEPVLQENNLVEPVDCTKGAGITYENIRIIIPLQSVTALNTQTPKKAIAAFYKPPQADGSIPECTNEKVQWRLEIALHHGLKEYENLDWSSGNFKKETPGEIAQSKGVLQAYRANDAVTIDVVCSPDAASTSSNNNCNPTGGENTRVCDCNKEKTISCASTASEKPNERFKYCYAATPESTDYACRKSSKCRVSDNDQILGSCVCTVDVSNVGKEPDCGKSDNAANADNGKFCYKNNVDTQPTCHKAAKPIQQAAAATPQPTAPAQSTASTKETVRIENKDWFIGQKIIFSGGEYIINEIRKIGDTPSRIVISSVSKPKDTEVLIPSDFENNGVVPAQENSVDTAGSAFG
ncbi:TPA: fibronectin type III domain-containing protein [Candidatus Woesearchaeota archaeon]|nr:fibronectin type III domain-containing protein [Candidatus Woesearchaeota archaeon]